MESKETEVKADSAVFMLQKQVMPIPHTVSKALHLPAYF